ncbi:MAG: 16S rRNA (cytosine(1402)-N(4))-methyltransferase RsmH [Bacteroidetes bacterium]|nr:16S rRNA (cytosine(1402)-N(4))-methyltransferase RsmH [Bacteroidota bacterium]
MDYHIPVLAEEVLDGLAIRPNGVYVDGTLGGGGHSEKILEKLNENGRCLGFDVDPDAIAFASKRLERFGDKFKIVNSNFSFLSEGLYRSGFKSADGILLDLGVSSRQLDNPEKGFSFRAEANLDLRLDPSLKLSAADVINTYSDDQLCKVIRDYGEEQFAWQITKELVKRRAQKPFVTTTELTTAIDAVIFPDKRKKSYARVFQALRIEVNRELEVLKTALAKSVSCLAPGGRLVVISYHSLEDRIVKDFLKYESLSCICPPQQPICQCGKVATVTLISRKPLVPSEEECERNPRSRSAKLRIAERK